VNAVPCRNALDGEDTCTWGTWSI